MQCRGRDHRLCPALLNNNNYALIFELALEGWWNDMRRSEHQSVILSNEFNIMDRIKAFAVSFPEAHVTDLKERLARTAYPDELGNAGWDMGTPLSDVQRICEHWRTCFNWKEAEARLNELPQFTTPIQCDGFEELSIHFVHVRSQSDSAIPLLFSHGWPGSFIEVSKVASYLTESQDNRPAFHVVAPSLPNFGFSQGTKKRGFAIEQYAETCHKLMLRLGYEQYATQGGKHGRF